ncbi:MULTISPECIES: YceI family protein [Tenacibaculum]|uniref:YceI family protein n=1 Tax=Tenacibaculum TaxID=104267 RepID=UPI001F0B20BB|nr:MULTISPECIES: YceI family protein [Tenacibaculum]MCH3882352.1 YceI family protein [Tenacibaculum aquimarinum]MCH3885832.1 YceI family protein [Tenacibaculum aquimarinum]MDO6600178.1 YceI family protein [Tenacibaculum sp. 1_MG-2023]
MKKLIILLIAVSFSFQFTACKSEVKKEIEPEKTAKFSLENAENNIGWTAYKTTEKIGVNGQFNKIDITKNGEGNSIKEAINNVEFSIPVSSIFTKDKSRDYKIQKFFFGIMENTSLLSGKLSLTDETNGVAEITMNGITEKLPFTYTIADKTFSMTSIMNIENWKANKALASLNEACKDLHSGADGISKTWNEVALNISSTF